MEDLFKRKIDYLRISVTDQCNLRCVYCVPDNPIPRCSPPELLTDLEIVKAASIFSSLGVSSIRITGGEPLMRPGICELISKLKNLPGVSDLSLTSNGIYLKKLAPALKRAGLNRINLSLDTLDPLRFKLITGSDTLDLVLQGVEAALDAGLSPVKINVVLFRGINDTEIEDFVNLTAEKPVHLRFIEAMPMGSTSLSIRKRRLSPEVIFEKVPSLKPLHRSLYPRGKGPARYFSLPGAIGTIGVINAISNHFCSSCNRVRLDSRGNIFPCLDSREGVYIGDLLRQNGTVTNLRSLFQEIIRKKPLRHRMGERISTGEGGTLQMSCIGG